MTGKESAANLYHIRDTGFWAQAWKIALLIGVLGAVWVALTFDANRFAFSYLFAFATCLTMGLGGLFFLLIQHISAASWSVSVRRTAEFFAAAMPVLLILSVPVFMNMDRLYSWTQAHGAHHGGGATHAEAPAHEAPMMSPGEAAQHHHLLEHKAPYLNKNFFLIRAAAYFAIWILLSLVYFRWSTTQDRTKDAQLTVKMQSRSAPSLVLFGFTLTFAAFDWLMSLEPTWFSTIFGVYVFAGAAVSIHALVIVVTLKLRSDGYLGNAVNEEHYHDLGKLMFGFICFWTYIAFSQWMLIWYAGLPEEATYYHHRWSDSGWQGLSMVLIFGHFAGPFLFLISRLAKRNLAVIGMGATWMLLMHVLDMYWFVMPYAGDGRFAPKSLDVACLFAVAGIYFAAVFSGMKRYSLIPVGDPRLERSLHFVNA